MIHAILNNDNICALFGRVVAGITSAQEFEVCIHKESFILRAPGRYKLV